MNMDAVLCTLQQSPLADNELLVPNERAGVRQTLTQLAQRGLHAYVVVLPQTEDVHRWRQLWTLLGVRDTQALLLLYNGRRWEARGWGLAAATIAQVLTQTESALRQSQGDGLSLALTRLAEQTTIGLTSRPGTPQSAPRRPAPSGDSTAGLGLWVGGGALVVLGAVGWLLYRRRLLQQQQRQTLQAVCDEAEAAFAQVMLADAVLDPTIRDLQWQATTHKQHLEALLTSVSQGQRQAGDPVLLGEVQQLTNQFAALHSAILRREKERSAC